MIVGEVAHGVEDVGVRGRFLEAQGLARHVGICAPEILEACVYFIKRPVPSRDHYLRRSINTGLSVACDEILGPSRVLITSCGADGRAPNLPPFIASIDQ
jgi:hypothetical protein